VTGSKEITITGQNVNVEDQSARTMRVYPNPATTVLYIENAGEVQGIDIVNTDGRLVRTISTVQEQMTIDVSGLPGGVYFIRSYQKDQVNTIKLVK
jgi:hypothetical protein